MVLDIIVIILIVFSIYKGYKKGLIGILVGLVSLILSIVLGFILQTPISNYLYENTKVGKNIEEKIIAIEYENINNSQNNKYDKEKNILNMFNSSIKDLEKQEEGNVEQVAKVATMFILKGISFIAILILVYIICFVLQLVLKLVFDLPLLNVVNKFGGVGANLLQSLLKIWIFLGIVYFVSSISSIKVISNSIEDTTLTKVLYENNILVKMIETNLMVK